MWQRTTGYSEGSDKMETILIECYQKVWSLNRLWKSQIL